jgi:hypothetical protein
MSSIELFRKVTPAFEVIRRPPRPPRQDSLANPQYTSASLAEIMYSIRTILYMSETGRHMSLLPAGDFSKRMITRDSPTARAKCQDGCAPSSTIDTIDSVLILTGLVYATWRSPSVQHKFASNKAPSLRLLDALPLHGTDYRAAVIFDIYNELRACDVLGQQGRLASTGCFDLGVSYPNVRLPLSQRNQAEEVGCGDLEVSDSREHHGMDKIEAKHETAAAYILQCFTQQFQGLLSKAARSKLILLDPSITSTSAQYVLDPGGSPSLYIALEAYGRNQGPESRYVGDSASNKGGHQSNDADPHGAPDKGPPKADGGFAMAVMPSQRVMKARDVQPAVNINKHEHISFLHVSDVATFSVAFPLFPHPMFLTVSVFLLVFVVISGIMLGIPTSNVLFSVLFCRPCFITRSADVAVSRPSLPKPRSSQTALYAPSKIKTSAPPPPPRPDPQPYPTGPYQSTINTFLGAPPPPRPDPQPYPTGPYQSSLRCL